MHGKERATHNYNASGALISGQEFEYSIGSTLSLVDHKNKIRQSDKLGISVSAICDSRTTDHTSDLVGINTNLDLTFVPMIPATMFLPLPNTVEEETRMNTVALNKIITKKGILRKQTVTENGASVVTENILFDDKTGFVVLSKTTNEFNDTLYKFHYPADWIYDGVSAAYVSSDLEFTPSAISGNPNWFSTAAPPPGEPSVYDALAVGDEIIVPSSNANPVQRYWITQKLQFPQRIHIESENLGDPVGLGQSPCRVIRPGRRNQLMLEAGSVVTRVNPMQSNAITLGVFGPPYDRSNLKIINASMQEFSDKRIPYCNCDTVAIPPGCVPSGPPPVVGMSQGPQGVITPDTNGSSSPVVPIDDSHVVPVEIPKNKK